jgi:prepilin-type N-terminal cleavage/methylation domain-containing protein
MLIKRCVRADKVQEQVLSGGRAGLPELRFIAVANPQSWSPHRQTHISPGLKAMSGILRRFGSPRANHTQPQGSSPESDHGFSLVEMLVAIVVLTLGLLSAGQLFYAAMASSSLARSKGNAACVAQSKLETLSDLYRRNPELPALSVGDHGPEHVTIINPIDNHELNEFSVTWNIGPLPDPPTGRDLKARQLVVTVTPTDDAARANTVPSQNKVVNLCCIVSSGVS